jgi:hypothetical protein
MNDSPLPVKLFSVAGVTVASVLGGPLGGSAVLAINYRRLNQPRMANLTLLWGVVATAVLMGIAFLLPEKFPSSVLPVASIFAMYHAATMLQGETYTRHVERGGESMSNWAAAGVGVLALCATLAVVFCVVLVLMATGLVHPDPS